jgi:hypothetical protein
MLGFAALVALAAMALAGVGTASADKLCLVEGHHADACPAGSSHSKIDVVGLTLGTKTALLLENKETIEECHSQVLALGSTAVEEVEGLKILIDTGGITFTSCSGFCSSAKSESPAWLLIEALTLDAFVTADGVLPPAAVLEGCPFGVKCLYSFTNATQLLEVLKNGEIKAKDVPLTGHGNFPCPQTNMSFDAEWLITTDPVNIAERKMLYIADN